MINEIIDFENGILSEVDSIKMFSRLLESGTLWHLQGFYQRSAYDMVNAGWLSMDGKILINLDEIE